MDFFRSFLPILAIALGVLIAETIRRFLTKRDWKRLMYSARIAASLFWSAEGRNSERILTWLMILITVSGLLVTGLARVESSKNSDVGNQIFAALQAPKLTIQCSRQKSTKVTQCKINSYESIYLVYPLYAHSFELIDFETKDESVFAFPLEYGTKVDTSKDSFQASIKYLNALHKEGQYWDTVFQLGTNEGILPDEDSLVLRIPVRGHSNVRIRIDAYKQGWSRVSPISFIGFDKRDFAVPPKEVSQWFFFGSMPRYPEEWTFSCEQVQTFGSSKLDLIAAIYERDNRIVKSSLESLQEQPDWANWNFDSTERQSITAEMPFRVHSSMVVTDSKDIYGVSFWQDVISERKKGNLESRTKQAVSLAGSIF